MNATFNKKITTKTVLLLLAILIAGILIGRWTSGSKNSGDHNHEVAEGQDIIWTCSMHPQIQQNEPGLCPICGMDLIPLDTDEEDADLPTDALRMSPTAMQLAQVQTMVVSTGSVEKDVRLSGKVTLNPQYAFSQNSHISGRIEAFYFNSLGEYIEKGDKIAVLFSPEIIAAQNELLLAYKNKDVYPGMYKAARDKFKLWKISEKEIDKIVESGQVLEEFPIVANHSGYLIQKFVERGDYVETGAPLFILSQLSKLWGVFDVYEKDAAFVKKGMDIAYSLPSMPGEKFHSKIDFVEPVLNAETRTLNARILIDNPNLDFKPEMLINGVVHSEIKTDKNKIIVPKSAVMWTGKHSVVYVKHTTDKSVGFQMRPVTLGPSLGNTYVIEKGLEPGEEIVVEGTFSVDAAAQLANKPSMMNYINPSAGDMALPDVDLNENQKKVLGKLYDNYFKIKDALVEDKFAEAKNHYQKLTELWQQDWSTLPPELKDAFENIGQKPFLQKGEIAKIDDIDFLRNKSFYDLSQLFIRIISQYGSFENTVYVQHCPMANNDKGADWLSLETNVLNPYYGSSMLRCGNVTDTIQ